MAATPRSDEHHSPSHDRPATLPGPAAAARLDAGQKDLARHRRARGVTGIAAQVCAAVPEAAPPSAGARGAGDSRPLWPRLHPDPAHHRTALLVGFLPAVD